MSKIKDLKGLKFGKLTAILMIKEPRKRILWSCHCDCGKESVIVRSDFLNNGMTKSCGCIVQKRKGLTSKERKTYQAWRNMIRRCYDPRVDSYLLYSVRGIEVCDKWRNSFLSFYEDMGKAPIGFQLDRINNLGNYEPSNCRWVTPKENCNNRRSTTILTAFGKTQTVEEWAKEYNLNGNLLRQRISRNSYSVEEALITPVVSGGFKFKTDRRLICKKEV